ncbi:MAG: FHA domain-containing protein [Candidatus Aminicenantes bacterium]|nr:FHA domain-containing protein [Candidatus Aminicenantes bacterium]
MTEKTIVQDERELRGWLVVLSGEWRGKDFPLFAGRNSAGSSHDAGIYLPDEGIEFFHFSIRCEDDAVYLTDLDSHCGVYIDQVRIYRGKIADETIFETAGIAFLIKHLQLAVDPPKREAA